jgi:hypothetical protein
MYDTAQATLRDVLRCEPYLIGETPPEYELQKPEIPNDDNNKHDITTKEYPALPKQPSAFQEFMRVKKKELALKFPTSSKKEIHEMALVAYRELKPVKAGVKAIQTPKTDC